MQARLLPRYELSLLKYQKFIKTANFLEKLCPAIANLKGASVVDELSAIGRDLFAYEIDRAISASEDPDTGVTLLDVPECTSLSREQNDFYGVATALAVTSNVFSMSDDAVNKTPFTVYAASPRKSNDLRRLGMGTLSPETKLGFHTDGVIKNGSVFMPRMIMLYNLSISYEHAGYFRWKPFSLWTRKDQFMAEVGLGHKYKIRLTPSIYDQGAAGLQVVTPTHVRVPIFVDHEEMGFPLYLNGNVEGKEGSENFDVGIIERLRESLQEEDFGYLIPQKTRRIIFASNLTGAHARDVFQKPLNHVQFTRIFLRSVDCAALNISD